MKYLVMETHLAYAIVLDEKGQFLKVANLNYQVGEKVAHVYPLDLNEDISSHSKKNNSLQNKLIVMVALAACLVVAFVGILPYMMKPLGTVRMQINPDIEFSVNRLHYVQEIKGLNEEGRILAEQISSKGKTVTQVSDALVKKAIDLGYLKQGGKVNISVNSEDEQWKTSVEEKLVVNLQIFKDDLDIEIVTSELEDNQEEDPYETRIIPLESTERSEQSESEKTEISQINPVHKHEDDTSGEIHDEEDKDDDDLEYADDSADIDDECDDSSAADDEEDLDDKENEEDDDVDEDDDDEDEHEEDNATDESDDKKENLEDDEDEHDDERDEEDDDGVKKDDSADDGVDDDEEDDEIEDTD